MSKPIKLKASYTVEAAILVPLILFVLVKSVETGVSLHSMVKEDAKTYEKVMEIDAVSQLRKQQQIKEMLGVQEDEE